MSWRRYGLDELNTSLKLAFLDKCASVGVKVLMPLGEPLSGGPSHYDPASMSSTGWLRGNVALVKNHSALLGYYICGTTLIRARVCAVCIVCSFADRMPTAADDCCGSQLDVSAQAQLYNAIKTLDPWHIVTGSLQCTGAFWRWTDVASEAAPGHAASSTAVIPLGVQPRLQLALDMILWEDYHDFDFPPLKDAPRKEEIRRGAWFEPMVNCLGRYARPYPGETEHEAIYSNGPTATRTSLWLSVLQYDTYGQLTFTLGGNAWAPPDWSVDDGWLDNIAVQGWAVEAKMLAPSLMPLFGSDALNGTDVDMVTVQSAELLSVRTQDCKPSEQDCSPSGWATSPVVARGFAEDCNSATNTSGVCAHVVVMNLAKTSPAKFALSVRLPGAPDASNATQPPLVSRLFANGGYDVDFKCGPDCIEGVIEDWLGAGDTVVYEIGCSGARATRGQPWQSCSNRRVSCSDFMWGCSHVSHEVIL